MNEETRKEYFKMVLEHPKAILAVGGLLLLVILALFGKRIGSVFGDNEEKTTTVTTREQGRSAVAGDNGNATAGDNSPIYKTEIATNAGEVINGPVGAIVNAPQAGVVVVQVSGGDGNRPIGAFARCKQLGGSAEFNAAIGVSTTPTVIGIEMATDMITSMMETKAAIDRRDRRRAMTSAEQTKNAAFRLLAYNVPFSDPMKKVLGESAEGPCESAWFRHDYEEMRTYAAQIIDACGFPPPIRTLAYKRLAELLEAGCEVYNPSPDELMKLKMYGKEYAYAYLNLFARWGYLHPRSVDPLTHMVRECSYKEFFGFDRELEYRETVCFRKGGKGGGEFAGNEISVLALGLWSFRYVDLSVAYSKCADIPADPSAKLAVEFDTGMKFDEWEIASALAKISPKVEPEVEVRGWKEEEFVVAKTDAFKFLQTDMPEVYYNEEIAMAYKTYCMEPQPVPEPSSAVLLIFGLAGLCLRRRNPCA